MLYRLMHVQSLLAAGAMALGAALSLPATAEDRDVDSVVAGEVVSGRLVIGRRTMALPAGEWRVVNKVDRASNTGLRGVPMIELYLDDVHDGRLRRTMQIVATKFSGSSDWLDEPCKSKGDSYWLDERKKSLNDQFCTRIGFLTNVVSGASGDAFTRWAQGLNAAGVDYSTEMPFVGVLRYTAADYTRVVIAFHPGLWGVPAQKAATSRGLSAWQPDAAKPGTLQASGYASLKEWAPRFASAVERAFAGDATLTPEDYGAPAGVGLPGAEQKPEAVK